MAFQSLKQIACDGPKCSVATRGHVYVNSGHDYWMNDEEPEYHVDTLTDEKEARESLEDFVKELGWYNVYCDHGGYFTDLYFHDLKCLKSWARSKKV